MSAMGTPRRTRRQIGRTLVATALVVVLAVLVGFWWWDGHRQGVRFTARFSASVGVYPGSDVRILGVPVGNVDSVTARGTYVEIAMHLDPDVRVAADTSAVIISPNLVSDRYVQLTGVYRSGALLRSGTVIPTAHTHTPVELDQLYQSLTSLTDALGPKGANATGSLSRVLETGAANLGGNGSTINQTITDMSRSTSTLATSSNDVFGTLKNLASFTGMLRTNDSALRQLNDELASVSGTLADDRQSFASAIHELGSALALVQTFVHDNRAALTSNVAGLSRVATTLAAQRSSLLKAVAAAPLLVQNFINAYDIKHNLLRGRSDLNELTVWSDQPTTTGQSGSATSLTAGDAPPSLLPLSNVSSGGGR